ncbi:hypothetical protein [Spirillospora sp. CA-128828]|uniref:hypothetical protein n=1 Tax=Spirillospora sp. CA-128828 TaxID=3240033 RepID=UPI003D8DADD7
MSEESDDQEFLGKLVRLAQRQSERHRALEARPQASDVQPGSPLAGDEAKSHPYQVGHGAWHALTVAQDHLLCLHSSLHGEPGRVLIHTHAQFTLIRAGLENAARAVWLLHSKDRATRVTRRLAMQRNEIRASYKMRELVGDPGRRTKQQALEELNTLLAAVLGVTDAEAEQVLKHTPVSYKDMVRDAAPVAGVPADAAELIWSAGSAIAHGDTHGTLSVLDKEVSAGRSAKGHGVAMARVTGSVSGLYWSMLVATLLLDTGYDLYTQRARSPFGR